MTAGPQVLAAVRAALPSLSVAGVELGARLITDDDVPAMLGDEALSIRTARPARRREFASGRALLRQLLGTTEAFPCDPGRCPTPSSGSRCTLAHDTSIVVAAITQDPSIAALGIDVESASEADRELAEAVLRPDESTLDPCLAFVIKEAAYKAWSTVGGRVLSPHDVHVELVDAEFHAEVVDGRFVIPGRWVAAGDRWMALAVLLSCDLRTHARARDCPR
ncbi:MAG: hypothetical protein WCC60_18005 [Ilumatobacteraceae bacterium]